jgi:hypothetical protein
MQQGKLDKLAKALRVIGHPTMLAVLDHMIEVHWHDDEPTVPTLIATEMSLPIARVAHSLKRMQEVGVLKRKVSGRYTFYSIDQPFLDLIKEFFP